MPTSRSSDTPGGDSKLPGPPTGESAAALPRWSEDGRDGCDFCGLTFSHFRESGRLGCPHCWATFEGHLRILLRRIHGSSQHLGKVYLPPDPTRSELASRLDALRARLGRAVEGEDFEKAALLRDQIRLLEGAGPLGE